jgi:hypothetical protein
MRILSLGIGTVVLTLVACAGASAPDGSGDNGGQESPVVGCTAPKPQWIWCDDFETNRLNGYFELPTDNGSLARLASVGRGGSFGIRSRFAAGQVSAGSLKLAFGRTPHPYFKPVDAGTADYREIYWRFYLRNADNWVGGGGYKLARATVFATADWAQAMFAHVWSGSGSNRDYLVLDPASGTDEAGIVRTTTYNDFPNMRWLGPTRGVTPLFDAAHVGEWYCIETRVKLNTAGEANGVFQLWIDGELESSRMDLNWLGSYSEYGINAIFLENYWNDGSPAAQERYFDDFVVSTAPVGC